MGRTIGDELMSTIEFEFEPFVEPEIGRVGRLQVAKETFPVSLGENRLEETSA